MSYSSEGFSTERSADLLKEPITVLNKEKIFDHWDTMQVGEVINLLTPMLIKERGLQQLDIALIRNRAKRIIEDGMSGTKGEMTIEEALIDACVDRVSARPESGGPAIGIVGKEGIVTPVADLNAAKKRMREDASGEHEIERGH